MRRRPEMLFGMVYNFRNPTEQVDRRALNLFTNWTPPQGFEIKTHYEFSDGSGGMATVEVASPEAMYEAAAPYRSLIEFKLVPIVEVSVAIPILQKGHAWGDSIS
jgi:hypothetical protein